MSVCGAWEAHFSGLADRILTIGVKETAFLTDFVPLLPVDSGGDVSKQIQESSEGLGFKPLRQLLGEPLLLDPAVNDVEAFSLSLTTGKERERALVRCNPAEAASST